ncbi:MAG: cob(I)yrinic acid a,c-diamide adenosyltransferase [Phycisphaerae bacterium]|nr:cob(I)yrinic acid a,c-diamide adenosyltransferase [Phycisphaerae bacterium]
MAILKQGLVQVYTGDGKGKTTASLGLAWRMLGWGGKVYICQFLKPADFITGEMQTAEMFKENLVLEHLDAKWNMLAGLKDKDQVNAAQSAIDEKLKHIHKLAQQGEFDLIILDELMFSLTHGLAEWPVVKSIIDDRASHVELVFTGRGPDKRLLAKADLITEMTLKRHPFEKGIIGRKGIEY